MSTLTAERDLTCLLPKLQSRARRLTGDTDVAQDLAQDAVLKLIQAERTGAKIEDPEAYAMTTLRHLVASRWRSRVTSAPLEDTDATTAPVAQVRLSLERTRDAIDRLPDEQAILMRCVAGGETSPAELAQRMGLPKGTVMSRLSRARARLRKDLDLPADNPVSGLY